MTSRKIMVLRSDRLGDLVLCSGYLARLVESFPDTRLDLWLAPETVVCEQILDPGLRVRALPFDRYMKCSDEVLRFWLQVIEAEGYQELIIPQFTLGYPEIVALTYASVGRRGGFRNSELGVSPGWMYLRLGAPRRSEEQWITDGPHVDPFCHEVEKYVALAAAQGLATDGLAPRLQVPQAPARQPSPPIIWPGCGEEGRRWPAANFAETAARLGWNSVEVGAAPAEEPIAAELQDKLCRRGIHTQVHICQPSELAETCAWLARHEVVLTNDTGIAHVGAALGCSVVAVSGAQHQGRFSVYGPRARTVFADVPCRQCKGCCIFDEAPQPCVAEIDVGAVVEAVRDRSDGARSIYVPISAAWRVPELFSRLTAARRRLELAGREARIEFSQALEAARRNARDAEAEITRVRAYLENAELQRTKWEALCHEAEAHRDERARLSEEAEAQRDYWQRLCNEAELQRDQWQQLCNEAEQQRDQWQRLCNEAEQQREHWRSSYEQMEGLFQQARGRAQNAEALVDRFYRHFPWARATEEAPLPKISIVTPSFQQRRYIEETIQSVLDQRYPNFEHIIVDAGSTDGTVDVLKSYPHLRWISEPDRGQAHAINKGLLISSGDIVAYLNSDDVYRPGAFHAVAEGFREHPEAGLLVGNCDYINESSAVIGHMKAKYEKIEDLIRYWGWDKWYCIPQQAVFMRRELLAEIGLFDVSFHMVLDYDMWLRAAQATNFHLCGKTLAAFRLATNTKTTARTHEMYYEELEASRRRWKLLPLSRRIAVSVEAHRHLANKLLDVAEHYAFEDLNPKVRGALLAGSARHWPALALSPRFVGTGFQLLTGRFPRVRGGVRYAHRKYLGLKWRWRQLRETDGQAAG